MGTRKEVKRGKRKKEGQTLTKNTRRAARRKIFPHKHVLFHKSSELSWNELEKKPERKVEGREETEDEKRAFQSRSILPLQMS